MSGQTLNNSGLMVDIPDLKAHLLNYVLPFWEQHSLDTEYGGFITHLSRTGAVTNYSEKFLVMQSRMIYSFAVGASLGGPPEWLRMAEQGVAFLFKYFRDYTHDGWYWSTSREGRPRQREKRTYGHAFAAYALAEYSRIAHDSRALAAATHTWSLVQTHLWDNEHEGAIEACDHAWRPSNKNHTMGTHLHLLEALLALDEAAGDNRFWPHVRLLSDLIVSRMIEPKHRCGLEHFACDWACNQPEKLVNYGHNLEAAWLLLRADQIEATPSYRHAARQFLDYCLQYGCDEKQGGICSHGPLGQPATLREKIWWVQTEAMVAFLLGYLVFRDRRYWEAFRQVVDFALRCLYDPEQGEWYASVDETGHPPSTDKGSEWKAAYHITQACCYAHRYLQELPPEAA